MVQAVDTEQEKHGAIDRYRLSRLHSEGGLGRVWVAADPNIGRDVALKELLSSQAVDPDARARFLGEAKITGQLEHPNIVPVYDVGEREDDRCPFYTMRFVRGPTLSDAIKEEQAEPRGKRAWPRSRQRLLRALCSVCNAISHAHSRSIIHRDLKPDNIILGPHGELLLLDWGLAKHIEAEDAEAASDHEPELLKTQAGTVMGTIAYMSPEQAEGQNSDKRTDIYGLGAILFEILTGQPPHSGDDVVSVLRNIIDGDSPTARSINPLVPAALDAICRKAMARQPGARYATANDIVLDLERWMTDQEVGVLPDKRLARITRWVRRNQSWAYTGTAAILLVSIVATMAALWLGAAADRERGLREHSIQVSAKFAARALSSDILLRWSILESAATSDLLRRELTEQDHDDGALQKWLKAQFDLHKSKTRAVSWIVQDRTGLQRARAPKGKSIGDNFAYRDYFHGQGRDLLKSHTEVVIPIQEQYRSIVFISQVTHHLMVAFSVPVFDTDQVDQRTVIGVLGMTVELGKFDILGDVGLGDNQMAVLIDTREDWKHEKGLVLQHAELARLRTEQDVGADPGSLSQTMHHLASDRVEYFQQQRRGIDPNYRDPVGGNYEGRWLAAFEPVLVSNNDGSDNDTGWVVVIQERVARRSD